MTTRREFIKNTALGTGIVTLGLGGSSSKLFANGNVNFNAQQKKITTVTGDILPEELGFTSMHEHTICDLAFLRNSLGIIPPIPKEMLALVPENYASLRSGLSLFSDECTTLGDVDYMVKEFNAFKKIGGNAVCDASPIGIRGNPMDLKEASVQSGIHLVCATGLYHSQAQPKEFLAKSEKELISYFEKEITEGIDGSDVRPGFLKCAIQNINTEGELNDIELKTFRACAKVAANNGMCLHVHTNVPVTVKHILQIIEIGVKECGMKADRLHIMHLDSFLRTPANIADYYSNIATQRGINTDLQTVVLDKGVSIGFDSWGMLVSTLPDDYDRLKALIHLIKKGYDSQIVLGHDVYDKSRGVSYGYTGFTHFAGFVLPILKQLGLEDAIAKLTVENPARNLAY